MKRGSWLCDRFMVEGCNVGGEKGGLAFWEMSERASFCRALAQPFCDAGDEANVCQSVNSSAPSVQSSN
jgi:hypothetical protein